MVYIATEYLTRVFERLKNLATPISIPIHFCMNFSCMHFFFLVLIIYTKIKSISVLFYSIFSNLLDYFGERNIYNLLICL